MKLVKGANRDHIKRSWNWGAEKPPKPPKPQTGSWWIAACLPGQRDQFIKAAHQRDQERWTTITPHLAKSVKAFR